MKTIKTVNVITISLDCVTSVISFPDTPEGNKEAEQEFSDRAKKIGASDEDMDKYLNDGYFGSANMVLGISLVHSGYSL